MITDKEIKKGLDEAYNKAGVNAYFGNGFESGVKFAIGICSKNNKKMQTCACVHETGCMAMQTGCCALGYYPKFVEQR